MWRRADRPAELEHAHGLRQELGRSSQHQLGGLRPRPSARRSGRRTDHARLVPGPAQLSSRASSSTSLHGWGPLMALPDAEKLALLRDPAGRAEMDRLAQSTRRAAARHRQLGPVRPARDLRPTSTSRSRVGLVGDIADRAREVAVGRAGRHRRRRRAAHRHRQPGQGPGRGHLGAAGWRCGGTRRASSARPTPAPTST